MGSTDSDAGEVRRRLPDFVKFHVQMNRSDPERPVASMCSVCRRVRSTDGEWHPFEIARELLRTDALFSHGLCEPCLATFETGSCAADSKRQQEAHPSSSEAP
jgi:hypothetical protein